MKDTLTLIKEMQDALRVSPVDARAFDAWWNGVLSIEASLEGDPRYSKAEQAVVRRLRTTVSEAIRAFRDGFPSPSVTPASVALTALQDSVERRTTGLDGWPIRR